MRKIKVKTGWSLYEKKGKTCRKTQYHKLKHTVLRSKIKLSLRQTNEYLWFARNESCWVWTENWKYLNKVDVWIWLKWVNWLLWNVSCWKIDIAKCLMWVVIWNRGVKMRIGIKRINWPVDGWKWIIEKEKGERDFLLFYRNNEMVVYLYIVKKPMKRRFIFRLNIWTPV